MGTVAEIDEKNPSQDRRGNARALQSRRLALGPGLKLYANLEPPEVPQPPPEGFYKYVAEPKPVLTPVAHGVVQTAVEARRKRILDKEASRVGVATTSCSSNSVNSSSETLLIPLVASAAADEVRG